MASTLKGRPDGSPGRSCTAGRAAMVVVAAFAVVGAWAPAAGPAVTRRADQAEETCPQPYPQILVDRTVGYYEGRKVVLYPDHGVAYPAPGSGTDLDLRTRWLDEGVDMDGDGQADELVGEIDGDRQAVSVTRGDGVLVLDMPGHALVSMEGSTIGDLDADGRDELVVLARPAGGGSDRIFVVPGTTEVGEHDLPEVAIEVPAQRLMGVGDQGDGPGADVVVMGTASPGDPSDPSHGETLVASGDRLMDGGPGSSAEIVPVFEPYEGIPLSVVDLGDDRPAIISGSTWPGSEHDPTAGFAGLVLNRSGTLSRYGLTERFDLEGHPELGWPPRFAGASAVRYITGEVHLVMGGVDRGGSIRAVWSVTDPCTALGVAGAPEGEVLPGPAVPAPPARPSPGAPGYTG